ncbi:KCR1 [Symbiodinium natans]|uniref:KCR1 protein n=1 Tax=Symbiodinium natans TaxID=878477 RepID=A0A812MW78_9DINO|nr:KCR1 [Symbiodinium natans]
MKEQGLPMDAFCYSVVSSACDKASRWPQALEVFREGLEAVAPSNANISTAVSACGRASDWPSALALLNELPLFELAADAGVCNACMSACSRGSAWPWALLLFEQMKLEGPRPTNVTFGAASSACEKGLQWLAAVDILSTLLCKDRRADTTTALICFNTALSACEKSLQWPMALGLFQELRREQLKPNTITFNATLAAGSRGQLWPTCLELMGQMRRGQVEVTTVTYNRTISSCQHPGAWTTALQLLEEAQRSELQLNLMTYTSTISALASSGQWQRSLSLLFGLRDCQLTPDVVSYNAAMDACKTSLEGHCDSWPWALLLFDLLGQEEGVCPNAVSVNSAADACGRGSFWEGAVALLAEASAPTAITYLTVLSACERAAAWQAAVAVLEDMGQHGQRWDTEVYTQGSLALAAAGRVAEALALYREILDAGSFPLWREHEAHTIDLHRLPSQLARLAVTASMLDGLDRMLPDDDLVIITGRLKRKGRGCGSLGCHCLYLTYKFFLRPGKDLRQYGEWAVVTGATDGIGKAYAMELARQGLNVLLIARNAEKLAETANELNAKYSSVAVDQLLVDFCNFDAAAQQMVKEKLAPLDVGILINNVGLSYPYTKYFHELTGQEVRDIMEVNMASMTWMSRIVLGDEHGALGMIARQRGAIVNTSSGAGRATSPLLAEYSAAKAYVERFSMGLGAELASKGVHVQAQTPLYVATKMAKIRRASWTVPSPQSYAQCAARQIGYDAVISPWWAHSLQLWLLSLLPEWFSVKLLDRLHQDIRKRGMRKDRDRAEESLGLLP